jgi:benzoyl-CoA reductase subunit D
MVITAGIDVGSGAVKVVVMGFTDDAGGPADPATRKGERILGRATGRVRKRDIQQVVDEAFHRAVAEAGVDRLDYIGSTGEGEDISFATGHFYGMTTHARGALHLDPTARTVLDIGALHARAVRMDGQGKVLDYKMTSQCASGSGQFLENIARYLGVSLAEVGPLSRSAKDPEGVSSICAVLAETDVINMVSRGISTPDILRGIHDSMGGRYARLLGSLKSEGRVLVSGGLAQDIGLVAAITDAVAGDSRRRTVSVDLQSHPDSVYAGAIGAAIWGAFRLRRIQHPEPAWTATATA